MARLHRIAPVFAVRDVAAALAFYARLGFRTREWEGGGYGFVVRDGLELHVGTWPDDEDRAHPATAYIWVDDADALARDWIAAGAEVHLPEDTPWGQHEGVLVDPDGNRIRFGSPMAH